MTPEQAAFENMITFARAWFEQQVESARKVLCEAAGDAQAGEPIQTCDPPESALTTYTDYEDGTQQ